MERLNWVAEVNQKAENMIDDASTQAEKWKKLSIYKVPAGIKGGNEDKQRAYTPQIVSIGPYHHGEDHLNPMEKHKQRALVHFLKRSKKPLKAFVDSVDEVVKDLMDSYYELDSSWKNDTSKFLQLMIVDGIFMLEVFGSAIRGLNYAHNDPIFSGHGKQPFLSIIKRDMLMLENQLPLLVLVKLVAVESNNSKDEEFVIKSLIGPFFFPPHSPTRSDSNIGKCLHILDVYRKILVFEEPDQNKDHSPSCKIALGEGQNNEILRPATAIRAAGIRFEESQTRSFKGASFRGGISYGLLRLPRIIVDHDTETLFLNLLAFERLHIDAGSEVTSYLALLNNIIKDEKDVRVLTSRGIIIKANVNDQTVAELFHSLPKDIAIDPESNLAMVSKGLSLYCKNPWNIYKTALRLSPEFSDPVKLMSFLIAYMVLPLTVLQTVFSVLGYYQSIEKP